MRLICDVGKRRKAHLSPVSLEPFSYIIFHSSEHSSVVHILCIFHAVRITGDAIGKARHDIYIYTDTERSKSQLQKKKNDRGKRSDRTWKESRCIACVDVLCL